MTSEELINMGFKKKHEGNDYWFELRMRDHVFYTNDTYRNGRKDRWFIGYEKGKRGEPFWFNEKLNRESEFRIIFHVLTGVEFKLAHQRKLIK